jgi:hypothetical protein
MGWQNHLGETVSTSHPDFAAQIFWTQGPLLSYERGGSRAIVEPLPGTSFMTGSGGGRTVPLLAVVGRL